MSSLEFRIIFFNFIFLCYIFLGCGLSFNKVILIKVYPYRNPN